MTGLDADELRGYLKKLYQEKYSRKALGITIQGGWEYPPNERQEEFREAAIKEIDDFQAESSRKQISDLIYELFISTQSEYFFWE